MNTSLVYVASDSGVIPEKFPSNCCKVAEGHWAVGSHEPRPADLMERLGMGQNLPGVIVKIDSYYGHFDQALWQKLNSWTRSQ